MACPRVPLDPPALTLPDILGMTSIVMASITIVMVVAFIVVAYIVVACIVVAYIVMAHVVLARPRFHAFEIAAVSGGSR